jgi:hypothetical protein
MSSMRSASSKTKISTLESVSKPFPNRLIEEWQLKYRRLVLVERLEVLIYTSKITAERKSINSPYSLILASI